MKDNLKHYRLSVSRVFPVSHPRKGEETNFKLKIQRNFDCKVCPHVLCDTCYAGNFWTKLHTIRSNYPLWEKRMREVQEGRAVIELFYWSDKPYRSKQIVFATLDKDSGCGVQQIGFRFIKIDHPILYKETTKRVFEYDMALTALAKNDGLSLEDFKAWFKNYDLSEPLAIIQFTKFRY